jgi:hypothetical protein
VPLADEVHLVIRIVTERDAEVQRPCRRSAAERIAALDDAEQHDDDRDDEKHVDEASEGVGRDDPEQPQDDEDEDEH